MVKIDELRIKDIERICDHTFVKSVGDFVGKIKEGESASKLRQEEFNNFLTPVWSEQIKPYAVCVRPEDIPHVRGFLGKKQIKLASVVGFPDGSWCDTKLKAY